ncbi:hypothetical protein [Paraburkholderia sediminicola]|uniref:hypothetical protein n=1 Tax=Paraburkholderia sediminicola TaxID=458836 RepID=UPI0038BA47C0
MTDEKITRLIATLREWGGKNTIHPHSGTWMLDAADALELLSASKPAAPMVPADLLPNALWTRNGSGSFEWWTFKGYEARKDSADQWVLRKAGTELYRHTHLQVAMAHAERELLAASPAAPAQSGEPVAFSHWESVYRGCSGYRFSAMKQDGKRYPIFEVDQQFTKKEAAALIAQLNAAPQPAQTAQSGAGTYAEFGEARERFLSGEPAVMSERTRELARQVLEQRDNDTRTDEEKIQSAVNFICDTRLDLPTVVLDDERAAFKEWFRDQVDKRSLGIGDETVALTAWQARAASPQPVTQTERALTEEQIDDLQEAREILENMVRSVELYGNYSTAATCTFLLQALQCLPAAQPASGDPQ